MCSIGKLFQLAMAIFIAVGISACAGVSTSSYSFNDTYKANAPVKAEECYDAAVLLHIGIGEARDISKKVLAAIDATISEETATSLKAQRNRHIGVVVGSGGEELHITLQEVSKDMTFVTAATKTGFVGAAGQKAWSCMIIDQIVEMASK